MPSCSIEGLPGAEKAGGFSRRPSGASENMVASENRSLAPEKRVAGGLEFGVFARSSGSRRRGVVGNIGVYVCRAEGELLIALKINTSGRGYGL